MRRKKWLALATAVGALGGLLLFQQAAWTRSFGTPIADQLLTVARGTGEDTILVTAPGPEEAALVGRIVNSGIPHAEKERLRKLAVSPGVYYVKSTGAVEDATAVPQVVAFEDPVTGEAMELELFAVEVNGKTRYMVAPGALPLLTSPVDSNLALLERNSALFLFDARSMKVTFLGDPEERRARLAAAAELQASAAAGASNDSGSNALNWAVGPQWSQNGLYIAFLTNRDTLGEHFGNSIWVHDLSTGHERVILHGQAGEHSVVRGWTSRHELVNEEFRSGLGGSQQISVAAVGLNGSRGRLASGRFVAQSADARTLIWLRQRGPHAHLVALDLGNNRQQVIWEETPNSMRLRSIKVEFSSDGRRVVTDLENSRNVQSLLVYDLKTGKRRILPVRAGWQIALPPAWIGQRILLPLERKGSAQTLVANPDEN